MAGAFCLTLHAVAGLSNRSLGALVAELLGTPYSASRMSGDLARLRLHGLIERVEHRHCCTLTDDGRRFAVFYSRLGDRVLPALFAADQPNAPPKIRQALKVIDGCIEGYTRDACLAPAA